MKKICILSSANIKHMTLVSLYTDILKEKNIPFDIIYMDKYGEEEYFEANNIYRYKNIINQQDSKIKKVFNYMKFINFAKSIIEKNNYNFIIVWNEITAIMFFRYLSKSYKSRYCLNYRDYLYQDIPIISYLNKKVIKSSSFTTISSDGYKKFLPKHDYIHIHSLNEKILYNIEPRTSLCNLDEKIKITFIGNVRFINENKKLVDIFKNDSRFELHFYGTNSDIIKTYCEENRVNNAVFKGAFPVDDTVKYIEKTDIVNNLYGNRDKFLDYALSIKLYYAVYYRTPILVNESTYMAEIIRKYNIGYVVSKMNKGLPEDIYKWYKQIDFNEFENNCKKFMNEIKIKNKRFNEKIEKYIL